MLNPAQRSQYQTAAVIALLTALCLALPTHNPTGDAWYYAACSRWGQELWQPHHLLYNSIGWAWLQLVGGTGPAAITWLQALNALALGGSLWALAGVLRRAGVAPAAVPAWLLLTGSCFGLLRFATENETYVQPLLLSLLGSLAWVWALVAPTRRQLGWLALAGLLAATACLVHQLMVWWWLGLLLGLRPWRGWPALLAAVAYALPALVVPAAYALAAPAGTVGVVGLVRFALHDYLTGGATLEAGGKLPVLTAINLVRTVGQMHGNMLPLLRHWPLLLGTVALACLALGVYALLGLRRPKPTHTLPATQLLTRRVHGGIWLVQFFFSYIAGANSEFMVMLPALAAVALAGGWLAAWPPRRVAALGTALLAWNLAFGLVPAHTLTYTDTSAALRTRVQTKPGAWFLLLDPNLLRNQLHYYTGHPKGPPRVLGTPANWTPRPGGPPSFRAWLSARLAAGDTVYTDVLGGALPFDRAQLMLAQNNAQLLAGYRQARADSFPTFFGPRYLTQLLPVSAAGQ
ncbi:MAG: hypothetical protein ACRYFX_31355 [Janthinobacterium lividum]